MAGSLVECSSCGEGITRGQVLAHMAQEGSAPEFLEKEQDLTMNCPACGTQTTLQFESVVVGILGDDAALAVFDLMEDQDGSIASRQWSPDFEEIVEEERKSRERKAEIQSNLEDLKQSLEQRSSSSQ